MAAHHHHHCPPPCCCHSCCYSPPSHPSHFAPSSADPLLQIIAAHLLQSQPPPHHYAQFVKTPKHQVSPEQQTQQASRQTHALLQSLVRRVAALETALRQLSSSPVPPSPSPSLSLRDSAARTIQTHFRAFLARRSRTLRQLRLLASIKSNLAFLKSCLSEETHCNPGTVSQKSRDLLAQLQSIQGGDSMIRDGKRSIEAELVHLLEFINGSSSKRKEARSKMKKVSFVESGSRATQDSEDEEEEEEEEEIINHGQIYSNGGNGASAIFVNGSGALVDVEGFQQQDDDDDDKKSKTSFSNGFHLGLDGTYLKQNGNSRLSAPAPLHMEPRGSDLMKKKKMVKIVNS